LRQRVPVGGWVLGARAGAGAPEAGGGVSVLVSGNVSVAAGATTGGGASGGAGAAGSSATVTSKDGKHYPRAYLKTLSPKGTTPPVTGAPTLAPSPQPKHPFLKPLPQQR
jgi:hypothetical protein